MKTWNNSINLTNFVLKVNIFPNRLAPNQGNLSTQVYLRAKNPGLSLSHYISTLVFFLPNCDLMYRCNYLNSFICGGKLCDKK